MIILHQLRTEDQPQPLPYKTIIIKETLPYKEMRDHPVRNSQQYESIYHVTKGGEGHENRII